MRLCHVFNMANDGWSAVKGLRAIGAEADLIVLRPSHVASLPQWEEAEIDVSRVGELHDPDWSVLNENWVLPDHVHVLDLRKSTLPMSRTFRWIRWLKQLGQYDIVIGHTPFAAMAPFYRALHRKPYVVYDAGWIRLLHSYDFRSYRFARNGYRSAAKILFTNVDTLSMFQVRGYQESKLEYTPFAIDTSLYRPQRIKNCYDRSPLFFSPSRQDWREKGNDWLLYAFQRYLKHQPAALLLLVEWGQPLKMAEGDYIEMAKTLIEKLGIQDSVKWLPVMPKRALIRYYNMADVVFDQYVFGALGTTTPEAMSCEKAVVSYVNPDLWDSVHGSVPPVANAGSTDEIYQRMKQLEDRDLRKEYERKGREWVTETCEMKLVASRQLRICEEILKR